MVRNWEIWFTFARKTSVLYFVTPQSRSKRDTGAFPIVVKESSRFDGKRERTRLTREYVTVAA